MLFFRLACVAMFFRPLTFVYICTSAASFEAVCLRPTVTGSFLGFIFIYLVFFTDCFRGILNCVF